jgi:hypothetical protein
MRQIATILAASLLVSLAACKDASFSNSTKRSSNLTNPAVDGKNTPGKGSPGTDLPGGKDGGSENGSGDGSGSGSGSGSGGKDDPTTPGVDNSGSGSGSGSGGGDITEENDTLTGPMTVISVKGLRLDSNDSAVTLRIKTREGNWIEKPWPSKGQTIEIEGVCSGVKDVELHFEAVLRGKTYTPSNTQCFVGKQNGETGFWMGFEHDCSRTNYNYIDDAIAEFKCPAKNLKVQNLRWDNGINLGSWVD